MVLASQARGTVDDGVRFEHAAVAQLDLVAHYGVGPDADALSQPGARGNDRPRIDFAHGSRSTILHMSVASAASSPSTVALPSNLQKSPRQDSTLTSRCN